ncbi:MULTISPECIES: glycosyltransferase [Rhizobium/Agrobacterium group]|uniref:glycosyltransferase n=1 Tax=Rhizobium/Agrobacterium group TaxID=227290 RepID=UPI001CD8DF21|nr:glycosyltransferase [Agrobacterium sp. MS2]
MGLDPRSEAFGLALVEAARAGKPMISCEIGTGTSFVNKHGETAYTIPPNDVASLSDAMLSL